MGGDPKAYHTKTFWQPYPFPRKATKETARIPRACRPFPSIRCGSGEVLNYGALLLLLPRVPSSVASSMIATLKTAFIRSSPPQCSFSAWNRIPHQSLENGMRPLWRRQKKHTQCGVVAGRRCFWLSGYSVVSSFLQDYIAVVLLISSYCMKKFSPTSPGNPS